MGAVGVIVLTAARRWTEVQTMRLIDADVANRWMKQNEAYMDAEILKAIPTVDAVPVVRCKDCKHRTGEWNGLVGCRAFNYTPMRKDDFCSYGERKDVGAEHEI